MTSIKSKQRGFSLVIAISILVIMGTLGLFLVRISGVQQTTVIYSMLGARAYQAAQTGIEWGAYQVLNTPLGGMCSLSPASTTTSISLTSGALAGFTVDIECSYTTNHIEGTDPPYSVFVLTSTATTGSFGNPEFASRTIRSTVTDAP